MTADEAQRASKPVITLDLDGVICNPPFGINLGIHSAFLDPSQPAPIARVPPRWWSEPFDRARFDLRRPLPRVEEALRTLRELRTVYLLTGRRTSPARWLARYRLDGFIDRVIINETALRSPHYKLHAIEELGAQEHVDDDGRTAQLIAGGSAVRVFLVDWPRNRGPQYHDQVTRVRSLLDVAEALRL
jgi:phosphoglycolate phosphatase-like HAD superfamily hydrolase